MASAVASLRDRLAARTLELVDISSESLHEEAIRRHLHALVPPAFARRDATDEACVWARERRPGVPLVLLVGHYDTVPAQGNVPGRIEGGAVHGCGASDMKGGVAVALELVRDLAVAPLGAYDVGLVLFGREELPQPFNPLPGLLERSTLARAAALAVLLEPTDLAVHAGCVGNVSARLVFRGVSGHSARPWLADNAIERALDGLAPIAALERREAVVAGLSFYETLTITRLEAGIADNVVPDRATATLNLRLPPDRDVEDGLARLRALVPDGAELEVTGVSAPGAVVADTPLVRALRDAGDGLPLEPKQAWTNVADFSAAGVDAVNFGPGATSYAHRRDELVEIDALVSAYETLHRFLAGPR
jgi:succinyl-diaminopimelate desuccinylase